MIPPQPLQLRQADLPEVRPQVLDAINAFLRQVAAGMSALQAEQDSADESTDSGALSDNNPEPLGTVAPGTSDEGSRSDHVHAHGDLAGGTLHAVAVGGVSAGFISAAGQTKLDNAAVLTSVVSPSDVGTTAIGASVEGARADHVHAHGNQLGGALHAVAVAGVSAGFMSDADKTRLDASTTLGQVLAIARNWPLP